VTNRGAAEHHEEDEQQNIDKEHQVCDCMIHQVFGGVLRSEVRCLKCSRVTTRLDPFTNLSLDITDSVAISGCLERYCRIEKLPGRDYKCAGCGTAQMATKQLSIHRLPSCLVLHIKRFEQTVQTPSTATSKPTATSKQQPPLQKIDRHLHFSTELHAADIKSSSEGDGIYRLVGVVVHTGSLDAGHYVAYVTHRDSWFKMDDAMITKVDGSEVLGTHAYMLFYTLD
jgi:ubiquitin carboxyl-terminal hydrolase 22/27/51